MSFLATALLLASTMTTMSTEGPERGRIVENVVTRADPQESYSLYLPSTYDAKQKYPLLLIFDPRGRGTVAANIFRDAAEEFGWILMSSNGTRSDESVDPNRKALDAMLPDIERYSVDPRRIYATGFSGTAMVAWFLGIGGGKLAGVIAAGGRLVDVVPPEKFSFAAYGAAGEIDFNNRQMRAIDAILDREGKVHRFREFPGPHSWMPPEVAGDAIGWMEIGAMKAGSRPRDEALAAKIFADDVAYADSLQGEAAMRRYRDIVRTYEGLLSPAMLEDPRAAVQRLERDPGVKREEEEIAKWDRFEEQFLADEERRLPVILNGIRQNTIAAIPFRLAREFRIPELKRHAEKAGAERKSAQRALESVYGQLAFYLPRVLFDRGEPALAAALLGAATEIHPERPGIWYALGAAEAKSGNRRGALDALEKSVTLGFDDAARLAADDDFATVRDDKRYRALVDRLH